MNCRALFYLLLFCAGLVFAQKLPNIAISPFLGDKTVSAEQLNFITGKFAGELMNTQVFNVFDRVKMDYILKEQGFQQTGACNSSECQVQMGQLLGVDFIVSGNLVRFGSKYAFRADYIDVGSGKVVYFVEQSESGELENVYEPLCQGAAKKLAQKVTAPVAITVAPASSTVIPTQTGIQNPAPVVPADALPAQPSKPLSGKRKVALALWGSSLLGAGGGFYFNSKGSSAQSKYDDAERDHLNAEAQIAYEDVEIADRNRNIGYGASIGTLLVGAVLWFLPEGK